MKNTISSASFKDSKPHYLVLDGFRGIAAIMVLWYHIFEAFATSEIDQIVNHGYLAVDFFFVLSGFVIAYAYDNRWNSISIKDFFKRRIIRLQPMVFMGTLIGAGLFYFQYYSQWKTSEISFFSLFFASIKNAFLIPSTPWQEIRGGGEMFPLNGPSWSLFFEYIGYFFYGFLLRKFSTKIVTYWTILLAFALITFAFSTRGYLGVGWTMNTENMIGGLLRILFSFSAGLLLARKFKSFSIKNSFLIGSLILIIFTAMPRIGNEHSLWLNALYDCFCVIFLFPLVVILGASAKNISEKTTKICKFLGDISFPLYMVHYPFIYWYYGWVKTNNATFLTSLPWALAVVFGSVLLAWILLKLYDEPIRNFLKIKFLK